MAPGLIEYRPSVGLPGSDKSLHHNATQSFGHVETKKHVEYQPGRTVVEPHDFYEHESLRPSFPRVHWDPLTEVPYHDNGIHGDSRFSNLLSSATDVFDYNPKIGTEIHGVNLASLTDAQKNDLARLTAVRGVVFFRNQTDLDIDAQRALGAYFGKLHKHATTAVPLQAGLEDVHVVHTEGSSKEQRAVFSPTFLWHSDVRLCTVVVVDATNIRPGDLRATAAIVHLPQATHWPSSRRRR